jgi:hypothetical protein
LRGSDKPGECSRHRYRFFTRATVLVIHGDVICRTVYIINTNGGYDLFCSRHLTKQGKLFGEVEILGAAARGWQRYKNPSIEKKASDNYEGCLKR